MELEYLLKQPKTIKDKNPVPVEKTVKAKGTIDKEPEFPGGNEALFKYVGENIKYPKALAKSNIEGKVIVSFIVSNTGDIENVKKLQAKSNILPIKKRH